MYVRRSSLRSCYSQSLLSYVPPCAIADTCELASSSDDAKRPHRGRSYRVALLSINGVGALTVRATLFNQAWAHSRRALLNAWAHSPRAANHPKIVTIRALYRDPMPLMMKTDNNNRHSQSMIRVIHYETMGAVNLHQRVINYSSSLG